MSDLESARTMGVPAGAQRSGSSGEGPSSGMREPAPESAGERYGACEDEMETAYKMTDNYYRELMAKRGEALTPPVGVSRGIAVITDEILFYKNVGGSAVIEIGRRLMEAKAQLSHGEWLPWLRDKVDFSERTATNFMRLAKAYGNQQTIADLGASKALALLALPESERESFAAEKHTVNGVEKSVSDMSSQELKQAIRERDEARLAAEKAKAEADAAEASRAKMETDMRQLKELQARALEDQAAKAAEVKRLEDELAAMRNRPVDIAVEVKDASPEQIAQARAEAAKEAHASMKQALQKELDSKEEQLRKAREDLKKAREEARTANVGLREAEEAARKAREAAEKAERAAKVNSSQNMVRFTILFNQTQETVNQMADAVKREPPENQEKMRAAMRALSDAIGKAAGT
ncbi:DUF3102 domain-containing protein [uncultured Dysosmobacter sp.]|uniref:DUF3102 domain-containing protein n=1 Tax=uncultured Dysosmobacter sp. TaxID=2591384 RepID=UPI002638851E|nr:DUF3102 domain-containing protein [uncultured Dysosmobacter sp.]